MVQRAARQNGGRPFLAREIDSAICMCYHLTSETAYLKYGCRSMIVATQDCCAHFEQGGIFYDQNHELL